MSRRRHEKQLTDADEYVKDWISAFNLISRIISVESERSPEDDSIRVFATGNADSVRIGVEFRETESDLALLSLMCDDAEVFPDIRDELRFGHIIEKRNARLCKILLRHGLRPFLLELSDEEQLLAGNAMMRRMAKEYRSNSRLSSFEKVSNCIEMGDRLEGLGLISRAIADVSQSLQISRGALLVEEATE